MSGVLVQPALRRPASPQPVSRTRPQTAVRTPARQPGEGRSRSGGRPPPPSTRERMEAAFGLPLDQMRVHTDAEAVELAAAGWTTRARILHRARAGAAMAAAASAAPEVVAATSPTAENALDAAKQQVAARATRTPPHTGPPDASAPPLITSNPSPPRALQVAPIENAAETGAPAREVEAVARGPPVPALSHAPINQTKLSVSSPGDPLEREADAVAARVLRGELASPLSSGGAPARRLQRVLPPARGPPSAAPGHAIPRSVASVIAAPGGGRPMDSALRARIEPYLGVDLGHVRIRQGPEAAAVAGALHARAFVSGTTIFLAAGSSPTDVALMAHEATHVAQQQTVAAARTTLMRAVSDFLPDVSVDDLIPDLLDGVRSVIRLTPGYLLLTYITGTDPLTDEPVAVSPEELIETLLTYGPFSAGVGAVMQSIDVLGEVFDFVSESLAVHNLTLARVQRDIAAAWDELSVTNGIAGKVAIVERYVAALLRDVASFVESIAGSVLEIVRSVVAEVTESLLATPQIAPVWDLAKKVMHYDPLRGVEVEAPTVEIIADFLRLAGEQERLAQMEERGTLQQTADWLDTQLATFQSLIGELGALYAEAWAAIQPENLPDLLTNLPALAQRTVGYVQHVVEFEATLILKILELVKQSLLGWLSEHAHSIPGFDPLTVILELNPFTGEPVERTAVNLIRGFITLMPGGAETYDQLAETDVIDQAAERIESEMVRLGISVELITGIFHGIWDTLTLDDLLDPVSAFTRILTLFGEPLLRLIEFVIVVIEVVIELVLRLMNFPLDLLQSVITNAIQAIDDIAADPIGFLLHMMEAVKLGFTNYFGNIVGHLTQGLVNWLFRGLGQLGIQLPTDFSLGSILNLVFQVLGLTTEHLWEKLAEHLDPDSVKLIRDAIDTLTGVWAFIVEVQRDGLPAIWRFISDQLSGLWTTLLSIAMEWIITRVVVNATVKLLSFLDPTFIMSVVNGFIAFFNLVASAIEYFRDMLEIFADYVSTLAAVAAGNVVPGAQMIEQGLANATPVAIGFLAKQVGIGNIPDKIAEIIGSVRGVVDDALDWLIDQALRLGRAALNALGLGAEQEQMPLGDESAEVEASHEAVLRGLIPMLEEERPQPEPDDAAWFAGKQRRAEELVQETQPRLKPGVRLHITVAQGQYPRQLLYEMDIAPNTTSLVGGTAPPQLPPQLTPGEMYTFFVDLAGKDDPLRGRFVRAVDNMIWFDPGESRKTEYRMSRDGRPLGRGATLFLRPAYRSDGTPNFRLAGVGAGEPPVFRPLSSPSTPKGTLAQEVEAEPLALSGPSPPRETPPGSDRILATLRSSKKWVRGHLVNSTMGGPGTNNNLIPIRGTTNAQMRDDYENDLRKELQLGKYFYFHALVGYHPQNASKAIGRPTDFVQKIEITYQEITKTGVTWTRTGNLTSRPAYILALPDLKELEPNRLSG